VASNGVEDQTPAGSGTCTSQLGFLPAATLGIRPTDDSGFAIDGWNNRIMYAVAQNDAAGADTPDFTTLAADNSSTPTNEADGMNFVGIANLEPELRVCSTSANATSTQCSPTPESDYLINNAVAVIYSLGATGSLGSGGDD